LEGQRREQQATKELQEANSDKNVLTQRTLRDANGQKLTDPVTGEGRRTDIVVADPATKTGKAIEVTSPTADKTKQISKERNIFDANPDGVYVRDPATQEMYRLDGPSSIERIP
jgi:hypothetical protein